MNPLHTERSNEERRAPHRRMSLERFLCINPLQAPFYNFEKSATLADVSPNTSWDSPQFLRGLSSASPGQSELQALATVTVVARRKHPRTVDVNRQCIQSVSRPTSNQMAEYDVQVLVPRCRMITIVHFAPCQFPSPALGRERSIKQQTI